MMEREWPVKRYAESKETKKMESACMRQPHANYPADTPVYIPYAREDFTEFRNDFAVGSYGDHRDMIVETAKINMMVASTVEAIRVLTDVERWKKGVAINCDLELNHTSPVKKVADGYLDNGTRSSPHIFLALHVARFIISEALQRDMFDPKMSEKMAFIMNPLTAEKMSISAEVCDYIQTRFPKEGRYRLPAEMYGVPFLVEDTVTMEAENRRFAFPDGVAVLTIRMDEPIREYAPDQSRIISLTSTLTRIWHQHDMTLSGNSVKSREMFALNPMLGFLFTECVS